MEAVTHELSLRYLLELSTDIRVAFLVDQQGRLVAAAPEAPGDRVARLGSELAARARAIGAERGQEAVEVDVTVEGGAAFVVTEGGPAMVCVTGPFALPGLIIHDMRIALDDLRRSEAAAS
jgi:hypothetical protein